MMTTSLKLVQTGRAGGEDRDARRAWQAATLAAVRERLAAPDFDRARDGAFVVAALEDAYAEENNARCGAALWQGLAEARLPKRLIALARRTVRFLSGGGAR